MILGVGLDLAFLVGDCFVVEVGRVISDLVERGRIVGQRVVGDDLVPQWRRPDATSSSTPARVVSSTPASARAVAIGDRTLVTVVTLVVVILGVVI